jgi:peptide/nickel transport system substrate-binding protein
MTRWIGPVCAAFLLLATGARAQPHDSVTIGMSQFPPDMHPYITSTSVKLVILDAMNRPMTGVGGDGLPTCLLCTELPSLDNGEAKVVKRPDGSDGMTVTYTLKDNLFWGDGVKLTARDIAFSFKVSAAFNPPQYIESVVADDDRHVTFTLRSPIFDYQRIGSQLVLPEHIEGPIFAASKTPLEYGEKSAFDRDPENPGLWFGPYKVASFRANDQVVMVRNPTWHGRAPYFRTITMRLVENTAALQANLLAGDLDTVQTSNMGITLDQVLSLSRTAADRFDFNFRPSLGSFEHLVLNLDNPLLADKRVRHAMSMAIDRKTIVARVFDNRFTPATTFIHPSQFGYDPSVTQWTYNPGAARALLAEAGFRPGPDGILLSQDGRRFSIDLISTAGNRTRELIEQVLQTEMKEIGIEVVIKNQPARVMFGETLRKREFTGMVEYEAGPAVNALPLDMLTSHYIPSEANDWSGRNYGDFHDPAMDAAMTAARSELDPEKRRALWKPILAIYADQMPEIPLYYPATAVITPKWMTGLYNPDSLNYYTMYAEDWRPK